MHLRHATGPHAIFVVRAKMCHILQVSQMVTLKCQEEMVEGSKESNVGYAATTMYKAFGGALEKPEPIAGR
jgi:hypothetical protein